MGIRPRDGWDDENPRDQSLQPQGYSTPQSFPQQQPQAQPQIHYVYLPQPPPVQQTVVVQNRTSSFGCWWILLLVCFPLWPITIPIAIIVYLCRSKSDSVTVVHSSGLGQPRSTETNSSSNTLMILAGVVVVIVILMGIASLNSSNKTNEVRHVVDEPTVERSESSHELRLADLRRRRRKNQAAINQISAAISESNDTDPNSAAHAQLAAAIRERDNIRQSLANEEANGEGSESSQPTAAQDPSDSTPSR